MRRYVELWPFAIPAVLLILMACAGGTRPPRPTVLEKAPEAVVTTPTPKVEPKPEPKSEEKTDPALEPRPKRVFDPPTKKEPEKKAPKIEEKPKVAPTRPEAKKGPVDVGPLRLSASVRRNWAAFAPDGPSKNAALSVVHVDIENRSDTKRITYYGWAQTRRSLASLEDEFGNKYPLVSFGPGRRIIRNSPSISGLPLDFQVVSEGVLPGRRTWDILVFDEAIGKAKSLTLTLPLRNVGQDGALRLLLTLP